MTPTPTDDELRPHLHAALEAAGLDASAEQVDLLLPAYRAVRAGSAVLRGLDLGETEPALTFSLSPLDDWRPPQGSRLSATSEG